MLWSRVALWCGVIFALSAVPNRSGKAADFETAFGILEFAARKLCHLAEYAVLLVLTYRALETDSGKPVPGQMILSFLFVLLYAATDEWHQSFVFGRNGTPADIFVDSIGALGGTFYCYVKDRIKYGKEKEIPDQSPAPVEN